MRVKKFRFHSSKDIFSTVSNKTIPWPGLVALVAVVLMSWFAKTAIGHEPAKYFGADSEKGIHVGKWGDLKLVPIIISPPIELISTDWGGMDRLTWFFPGVNVEKAAQMLQSVGISASDIARLLTEMRYEPRIEGVVLNPEPAWVRSLTPEVRARVYAILAKSELNLAQAQAFRYPGASPDDWLDPRLIAPKTRQLVEQLIYRDGDYMMFSDMELVQAEVDNDDELRRLSKTLFRQPTVIAQLSVSPSADIDALVEYWGRGGRDIKIRPLIESVAGSDTGETIDVIHLLPQFAQEHLYCYPTFSDADLNKPALVNCLWTSLNFFQQNPDDRFLDPAVALKTLQEDYFIIEADFKLGDILAFIDEKGKIFHAAVYIADDIVFSKNGISSMAPWTLMTIDEVKEYYGWRSKDTRVLVHRRKDL